MYKAKKENVQIAVFNVYTGSCHIMKLMDDHDFHLRCIHEMKCYEMFVLCEFISYLSI